MNDEIVLEDILDLCTGQQKDGSLMAGSSIAVFTQTKEGKPLLRRNAAVNVPLEIHCVGGCLVIAAEFNMKDRAKFINATKVCMDWLADTSEDSGLFTFTIVPLLLEAKVSVILQNIVYCDFYKKENDINRLILAFDNNATTLFGTEDIDYDQIKLQVEKEIEQKERDLDAELLAYMKEKEEQENPFRFDFGMDIDDIKETDKEKGPIGNSGVRFGGSDDDEK